MKHFYILIFTILLSATAFAQNSYQFGIINNSGYNFSVVATPNFDPTGNTDISDIGLALMLPDGNIDVTNVSQFNGRMWTANEVPAATLTGFGGDGTEDAFVMNLAPGQTLLSHTSGQAIVLFSFDVSNMPTNGAIRILTNTDPIALGFGGAVDSFYNANIDGTSTQNYFNGLTSGQESFSFDTLGIEENTLAETTVSIDPNPASEFINIRTSAQVDRIDLFDITGKKVMSTTQKEHIKVNHLPIGVYLLKVYSARGSFTKKVVIN
nr:T9SS type A sorting domain-containing protein [uncultured Psychroserpens sp.]